MAAYVCLLVSFVKVHNLYAYACACVCVWLFSPRHGAPASRHSKAPMNGMFSAAASSRSVVRWQRGRVAMSPGLPTLEVTVGNSHQDSFSRDAGRDHVLLLDGPFVPLAVS